MSVFWYDSGQGELCVPDLFSELQLCGEDAIMIKMVGAIGLLLIVVLMFCGCNTGIISPSYDIRGTIIDIDNYENNRIWITFDNGRDVMVHSSDVLFYHLKINDSVVLTIDAGEFPYRIKNVSFELSKEPE